MKIALYTVKRLLQLIPVLFGVSVHEQYLAWLMRLFQGDLGESWFTSSLLERPNFSSKSRLSVMSSDGKQALFAFPLRQTASEPVAAPTTLTGFYVVDILLTQNWEALQSSVDHLALPVITLAVVVMAPITRLMRAAMLEISRAMLHSRIGVIATGNYQDR